jgi:AraC family transcriptional regulator
MKFPLMTMVHKRDREYAFHPSTILASNCASWDELQFAHTKMPAFYMPEHTLSYHSLCINVGQSVTLERKVDGHVEIIDALPTGDVGFYPAHLRQAFEWDRDAEVIHLFLHPNLLLRSAAELGFREGTALEPKLQSGVDPLIQQMVLAIKTALEINGTTTRLYVDTMAHALAVHLLTHYSTDKTPPQQPQGGLSEGQLKQVLDCIHDAFDQEISLAELASLVHLSPYHFSRLFKQSMGVAPHQYHIRYRIDCAKKLLVQRKISLSEIAISVGFASQGHLNYHFRRWVGTTPTKFLAKN